MAFGDYTYVKSGENITYDGEAAKVLYNTGAYLTIKTDDGKTISVPKDAPLLSFANNIVEANNKWIEKLGKKRDAYEIQLAQVNGDLKDAKNRRDALLSEYGNVENMSSDIAKEYKETTQLVTDNKFSKIALGNRIYSTLMSIFGYQVDNMKYCNLV